MYDDTTAGINKGINKVRYISISIKLYFNKSHKPNQVQTLLYNSELISQPITMATEPELHHFVCFSKTIAFIKVTNKTSIIHMAYPY